MSKNGTIVFMQEITREGHGYHPISIYDVAKEVLEEFCNGDTFEFASHEVFDFERWLEEKINN